MDLADKIYVTQNGFQLKKNYIVFNFADLGKDQEIPASINIKNISKLKQPLNLKLKCTNTENYSVKPKNFNIGYLQIQHIEFVLINPRHFKKDKFMIVGTEASMERRQTGLIPQQQIQLQAIFKIQLIGGGQQLQQSSLENVLHLKQSESIIRKLEQQNNLQQANEDLIAQSLVSRQSDPQSNVFQTPQSEVSQYRNLYSFKVSDKDNVVDNLIQFQDDDEEFYETNSQDKDKDINKEENQQENDQNNKVQIIEKLPMIEQSNVQNQQNESNEASNLEREIYLKQQELEQLINQQQEQEKQLKEIKQKVKEQSKSSFQDSVEQSQFHFKLWQIIFITIMCLIIGILI